MNCIHCSQSIVELSKSFIGANISVTSATPFNVTYMSTIKVA